MASPAADRRAWTRQALTRRGFQGWLPTANLLAEAELDQEGAVYVVYRTSSTRASGR